MGTGPYKRVVPGQVLRGFPASLYNDLVRLVERSKLHGKAGTPWNRGSGPRTGWGYIKNGSNQTIPWGGVLRLTGSGMVMDEVDDYSGRFAGGDWTLRGIIPNANVGDFAVTMEEIGPQRIGRAWVDGVFPAKVDVTDTTHRWADLKTGDATQLRSAISGAAKILWKQSGMGTKWALVRLGREIPTPGGPYQVLQVLDIHGAIGWDWVRAAGI